MDAGEGSESSSFESMDSKDMERFSERLWETFADTQDILNCDGNFKLEKVENVSLPDLAVTPVPDPPEPVEHVESVEAVSDLKEEDDFEAEQRRILDSLVGASSMSTWTAPDDEKQAQLTRMYKKKLREAAALRLKRKRDERRMNGKGCRYAGRKKSAESRPRVNGRFVKRPSDDSCGASTQST